MTAKTTDAFRGKVAKNSKEHSENSSDAVYLILPSGIKLFTPETKKSTTLDFLPYIVTDPKHLDRNEKDGVALVDSPWYKKPFLVHKNVGVDKIDIVCPRTFGKKCPICEHFSKRQEEGADWETELKLLKPSERVLYAVVVLDSKKYDPELIYIFDISYHLFQKLLKTELEEDDSREIFPSLEDGLSLKVRFDEEKYKKWSFAKASKISFEPRDVQYDSELINDVPNLDECLKLLSYDEIHQMFWELDGEGTDDDNRPIETEEKKPLRRLREPVQEKEPIGIDFKKHIKNTPKVPEPKSEIEYTWEMLEGASFRKLSKICVDEQLTVQGTEFSIEEIDDFRIIIAEELDVEIPQSDPEPEKPAKSVRRQSATKPVVDTPPATRRRVPQPVAVASGGKDRCPHGHVFGKDLDMFPECAKCTIVDDCEDEYNKNKK